MRQLLFLLLFPTLIWAQSVQDVYIDGQGAGTGTVGDPWNDCAEFISEYTPKDLVTNDDIVRVHYVDGNYTDTSTCLFNDADGWVTSSTQYIEVVADFYHGGAWDEDKPILKSTSKGGFEIIEELDVKARGLQIQPGSSSRGCRTINIFSDGAGSGNGTFYGEGLLLKDSASCASPRGLRVTHSSGAAQTVTLVNSVIYGGFLYGIEANPAASSTITLQHIVSHGCDDNNCRNLQYSANGTGDTLIIQNSAFLSPSGTGSVDINASAAFATETLQDVYCSDADADAKCTSDNVSMTFTDTANGDFHLDSGSTDGVDEGTDIAVIGDFDEASSWVSMADVRSSTPDIGADEISGGGGGGNELYVNANGEN